MTPKNRLQPKPVVYQEYDPSETEYESGYEPEQSDSDANLTDYATDQPTDTEYETETEYEPANIGFSDSNQNNYTDSATEPETEYEPADQYDSAADDLVEYVYE